MFLKSLLRTQNTFFSKVFLLLLFSSFFIYGFGQNYTLEDFHLDPALPDCPNCISKATGYWVFKPAGYDPTINYPAIYFFHGRGEQGPGTTGPNGSLQSVLNLGIPSLVKNGALPASFTAPNGTVYQFLIFCPQFQGDDYQAIPIDAFVQYTLDHYNIDQSRMYLTGLSMGGGATWRTACEDLSHANKYAAIVPMCGHFDGDATRAATMASANLPVWAFHNDNDDLVPWNYSNHWVTYINNNHPPIAAKLSTLHNDFYPHDCWTEASNPAHRENGMNIYEWMLQYSRGSSPPPQKHSAGFVKVGTDKPTSCQQTNLQTEIFTDDGLMNANSHVYTSITGGQFADGNYGFATTIGASANQHLVIYGGVATTVEACGGPGLVAAGYLTPGTNTGAACDGTTTTPIFTTDGQIGYGKTIYNSDGSLFTSDWQAYGWSDMQNHSTSRMIQIGQDGVSFLYKKCPIAWNRLLVGYITDFASSTSAACGLPATQPVYTDDGTLNNANPILYTSANVDQDIVVGSVGGAAKYYGFVAGTNSGSPTQVLTISYGNVTAITNCSGSTRNPIQGAQELLTNAIKIYPNPARKLLNIDIGNSSTQLTKAEIFDAKGASVMKSNLNTGKNQVNTSRLNAGIYILKLYNQEGKLIKVEKLVIQQ